MFRILYRRMSSIILNDKEKELFDVVRGCFAWKGRSTTARVAGGWLRDKVSTHIYSYVYVCILIKYLSL